MIRKHKCGQNSVIPTFYPALALYGLLLTCTATITMHTTMIIEKTNIFIYTLIDVEMCQKWMYDLL